MKRIRSAFRFVMPLAMLLGTTTLSSILAPTSAMADWQQVGNTVDGWSLFFMNGSDGQTHFVAYVEQNGHVLVSFNANVIEIAFAVVNGGGDPSPDQDTDKGISKPDIGALLTKVKGVTVQVKQMPENTRLGKWLDAEGSGFVPHWNPGDNDTGKGPGNSPQKNTSGPTAKQLEVYAKLMNIAARELADINGSMGGFDDVGDSAPGLPADKNSKGGSGRGKGGGNGSDNNNAKNKYLGSGFESLGPHPELVNPPHSSSRGTAKSGSSGKSSSSSSAMNPGLLEGGSTFGSQGPAATGSPAGTSSRGAASAAGIR